MIKRHAAGHVFQVASILFYRIKQPGDCGFAFSCQHTVHSTAGVLQDFFGNK